MTIQGITEGDIANYLVQTPGFFERHAELLATIQLSSPHGTRAVSLQERQMQMLRERIKGLEHKIIEMIRAGQENMGHADRLQRFTLAALRTADAAMLPGVMVETLKDEFLIPAAALRLWGLPAEHAQAPWAQPVSEDIQALAGSLSAPYCGVNAGFEAAQWLGEGAGAIKSVAMIPLRQGGGSGPEAGTVFGLLVLGSPDATRYTADMGTEFLERLGQLAGAALARLRS